MIDQLRTMLDAAKWRAEEADCTCSDDIHYEAELKWASNYLVRSLTDALSAAQDYEKAKEQTQ